MSSTTGVTDRSTFEKVLDSTPDGIFVIDKDKHVLLFNKAFSEISGHVPGDIRLDSCSCNEIIKCHTEDGRSYATSLCPAKSVFKGEISYEREEMLLTNAQGEERWIETTYSPMRDAEGNVEYVVGVLRDVHERKMLEERLNQTEKLASFGQLVAGIAHEIKNPLAIVMTSLDVMQNEERPKVERDLAASFIREEIRRLDQRLGSFLAFARPQQPILRPTLLSGLINRQVMAIQPVFGGVNFDVRIESPEPIAMVDADLFQQVLMNLIMNAGDAVGESGSIRIHSKQQGAFVVVEVEDSGAGVPDEYRSRVFDPFFTTKAKGTGLGLSVCYQIILSHRGTISVSESSLGGACFTIRLPISSKLDGVE